MDKQALNSMMAYCSQAERCVQDVLDKLGKADVNAMDAEEIVCELVRMDYINEQRYATAFAHDKFRFNKWGKLKISYGLRQKKISSEVIQQALDSLDEIDYEKTLLKLIESKQRSIKGTAAQQKAAVIRFALSRGFEYDKIQKILR